MEVFIFEITTGNGSSRLHVAPNGDAALGDFINSYYVFGCHDFKFREEEQYNTRCPIGQISFYDQYGQFCAYDMYWVDREFRGGMKVWRYNK